MIFDMRLGAFDLRPNFNGAVVFFVIAGIEQYGHGYFGTANNGIDCI